MYVHTSHSLVSYMKTLQQDINLLIQSKELTWKQRSRKLRLNAEDQDSISFIRKYKREGIQ